MEIRLLTLIVWWLALSASAGATGANSLTPAEKSAGWTLLFDGKSLAGWRGYKIPIPAGWSVQHGALVHGSKRSGDLVTVQAFEDFELSLEWKIGEAGNSGIIYRAGLGDAKPAHSGPEYQLLDNAKAKDNKIASHLTGSLYDLVAPKKDVARPAGAWNEARVRVRGWRIEHWLNGAKVVDIDLTSTAGKALIERSKFKDWPRFATVSRGHIALQDHGDPVSFRSIKIRELR